MPLTPECTRILNFAVEETDHLNHARVAHAWATRICSLASCERINAKRQRSYERAGQNLQS
jgi:hypothetical protein